MAEPAGSPPVVPHGPHHQRHPPRRRAALAVPLTGLMPPGVTPGSVPTSAPGLPTSPTLSQRARARCHLRMPKAPGTTKAARARCRLAPPGLFTGSVPPRAQYPLGTLTRSVPPRARCHRGCPVAQYCPVARYCPGLSTIAGTHWFGNAQGCPVARYHWGYSVPPGGARWLGNARDLVPPGVSHRLGTGWGCPVARYHLGLGSTGSFSLAR